MPIILSPRPLVQRSHFYQQLGQLLAAGVTINSALDMLGRNPPSYSYRQPIHQIQQQIAQGGNMTDAMTSLGKWMPTFDLALIQAGESSGRLDIVFRLLANYYAERAALVQQTITDLAYPMFLFHFAVLIFAFVEWIGPGGTTIKATLHVAFILVPAYTLAFLMIYAAQSRRGEAWRSFMERVLTPVPVLGAARHSIALSRLAAALEALINAGVRIIEAWELAAAASGSPAIYRTVISWKPELAAGRTPSEMVSSSRQFPEVFANLYHSGEMSGQLDESLQRLHDYYRDEGTRKMRFMSKWVPQMIYLGIMFFIAYKIVSYYVAYFNQARTIGGY